MHKRVIKTFLSLYMVTNMVKKDKLLNKALNNPKGLKFKEFETLLTQCGWIYKRQKGSHAVWMSPSKQLLPVQATKDGGAKPYQVKQFIQYYNKERTDG